MPEIQGDEITDFFSLSHVEVLMTGRKSAVFLLIIFSNASSLNKIHPTLLEPILAICKGICSNKNVFLCNI